MTLRECYAEMEADYEDVMHRLGTEERVQRFLNKLLDDRSFPALCEAWEAGDCAEAFRAAHSLKGICMNLGLSRLLSSSSALTEALRRQGPPREETARLIERVKEDYRMTARCIRRLAQPEGEE